MDDEPIAEPGAIGAPATPPDALNHLLHPDDSTLARLFWQDSVEAMQVIAPDRSILASNPAAAASLTDPELRVDPELIRRPPDILDVDGAPMPREQWPTERAFHGETVHRVLVQFDGGDGIRQKIISAHPIGLLNGQTGALIIWHDVTDSWRPTGQSNAELVRLRTLLEGATDYALVLMDMHGRVRSWSLAAERLYGYDESHVVGMHYSALFEAGDRDLGVPQHILTQAVASGRAVAEGKRVRGDGSLIWAHCVVTSTRSDDGTLTGFVMVAHDVSERRASERAIVNLNEQLQRLNDELEARVEERTQRLEQQAAELAAANFELEAFSYSVSHDLRAPLRSVVGFTSILQEEYAPLLPDEGLHYLQRVNESAVQMGSLIDALLDFSRMQRQSMSTTRLDMTRLVARCWENLAPARQGRQIEFALGQLPGAVGDQRLIQQVWWNLLDNAVKYTSAKPKATIEVYAEPSPSGVTRYVVRDDGAGFDDAFADKIGQVFQRLHRADDFPGNGIGLALVQRIVQRHGGTFSASGAVGQGATFGFTMQGAG